MRGKRVRRMGMRARRAVGPVVMVMALLDVIAGFSVTIFTARRDLTVGENVEL